MPNWVCNHLTIYGENAVEVLRSYLTENEENECGYDLDFNKLIPMPEDLDIVCGSITTNCAKLYVNAMLEDCDAYIKYAGLFAKAFERDFILTEAEQEQLMQDALRYKDYPDKNLLFLNKAEVYAYGKRALDNYAKYGATDWYDWRCENWGSKWNACDTQINDPEKADIYFNTAWSAVPYIIAKIAELHPECKIEYEYAEEDTGVNTGYINFENGEVAGNEHYKDFSKEAYEMFFSLWGQEDEFKFNPKKGTYELIDDGEAMG